MYYASIALIMIQFLHKHILYKSVENSITACKNWDIITVQNLWSLCSNSFGKKKDLWSLFSSLSTHLTLLSTNHNGFVTTKVFEVPANISNCDNKGNHSCRFQRSFGFKKNLR